MAWPDDLAQAMATDHLVWNDVETILYCSKTAEAPSNPATWVEVQNTLWLAIKKDMLPPDSPLIGMDLTVELPVLKLGAIVPKANDLMKRVNGTFWTVKMVELVATQQEYRVRVVKSTKR